MNKVEKIIEHAERHCQAHGVRLTPKRKQVLSGLLLSEKALSAYELVDYCKTVFDARIPAMSVYRILDFLQAEHLVHKLNLAHKYVACAHICCEHQHDVPQFLICAQCYRVKEIKVSPTTIVELQHDAEQAGFHLPNPQLEINCLCENCTDKKT